MNDYILLMHDDVPDERRAASDAGWPEYITQLASSGCFDGGSSIGPGVCVRKDEAHGPMVSPLSGYLHVRAESLDDAKRLVAGNPTFEAGGTVEIRELPRN